MDQFFLKMKIRKGQKWNGQKYNEYEKDKSGLMDFKTKW